MGLTFITGNKEKYREALLVFPDLRQMDVDLPEIQDIDAKEIITSKLNEAQKHHEGPFFVEDTSLYLNALNGLPGPLIKWFLKTMGNDGLAELTQRQGNINAEAKTVIGYTTKNDNIHFFEGSTMGTIVAPQKTDSFGWDPIFKPEGYDVTFAEMLPEEKAKVSMRNVALKKLKDFIEAKT